MMKPFFNLGSIKLADVSCVFHRHTLLSITPSVTSPISLRMASDSGNPYLAPDLGLSPQNSLCGDGGGGKNIDQSEEASGRTQRWVWQDPLTRSCISFCSRAMAFLVPTANTKVSMSSSFRVTLTCCRQTDC